MQFLDELSKIIDNRRDNPREGSYTCYLFASGEDEILKKIGEEAVEVILAAKGQGHQRVVEEVSDLFYHVLVLLSLKQVNLNEVEAELRRRHGR
jgi:phosphoribosyl-ATP pyrophosphohydrolase